MDSNTGDYSNENIGDAHLLVEALNIFLLFKKTFAKLKAIKKTLKTAYPLTAFLAAIHSGFEDKMVRLVAEAGADPTRLQSKSSLTPLREIQDHIMLAVLDIEEHKKRLQIAVKKAGDLYLKEMEKSLLNKEGGDHDLIVDIALSLNQNGEFGREFIGKQSKFSEFFDKGLNFSAAAIVAGGGAIYVHIDSLGRFIGNELAFLSNRLLNPSVSEALAKYVAPALLVVMFIYKEILDTALEYTFDFVTQGLFYPIFTGFIIGMYKTVEKENPYILSDFNKVIGEISKSNNESLGEMVKDCYEQSKAYYKRYDDIEAVENISPKYLISSKNFLECCRDKLSIFKKNDHVKACMLTFRTFVLIVQKLTARVTFGVSQAVAKPTYNFISNLGEALKKIKPIPIDKVSLEKNVEKQGGENLDRGEYLSVRNKREPS